MMLLVVLCKVDPNEMIQFRYSGRPWQMLVFDAEYPQDTIIVKRGKRL